MFLTTPGVERAIAAARVWADRLGSGPVRLAHLLLGLLDEEEGRPAALLERAALSVPDLREQLRALESPAIPSTDPLFQAARAWSITHRQDPEFLTDALLLAVLNADDAFHRTVAGLGLSHTELERILIGSAPDGETEPESHAQLAIFTEPDATAEADAARILDANFNRAREAARALEDYCRFALDDRFLTEQVKSLRHELAAVAGRLPARALLGARDTVRDVGRTATAGGEYDRTSPAHVAQVNLKRLQESLRSLEEYAKVFGPDRGRELEALRYTAYTLERAICLGAVARERLKSARLYVLLTRAQCVASLDWTIAAAARGGADVIQLREKNLPDRELLELARNVRQWTRAANVLFILNDRPDVARLAEADGVHLGQDDATVKDARRILGADAIVGVSTHSVEQLRQAVLDGADYVGLGPTFPSKTKPFDAFPGLDFVRSATAETSVPAFAIGGIGPANIGAVVAAGARRVAVGAAMSAAADPEQTARLLKAALPE